jgi:hypothetical protein
MEELKMTTLHDKYPTTVRMWDNGDVELTTNGKTWKRITAEGASPFQVLECEPRGPWVLFVNTRLYDGDPYQWQVTGELWEEPNQTTGYLDVGDQEVGPENQRLANGLTESLQAMFKVIELVDEEPVT